MLSKTGEQGAVCCQQKRVVVTSCGSDDIITQTAALATRGGQILLTSQLRFQLDLLAA